LLLSAVVFLLNACVTNGALGPTTFEQADRAYNMYTINWGGTFKGSKTDVFFKINDHAGNLKICGYYLQSSGNQTLLADAWLRQAGFYFEDKEIVGTSFLISQHVKQDARAACVVTKTKFDGNYMANKLRIDGNNVTVQF